MEIEGKKDKDQLIWRKVERRFNAVQYVRPVQNQHKELEFSPYTSHLKAPEDRALPQTPISQSIVLI